MFQFLNTNYTVAFGYFFLLVLFFRTNQMFLHCLAVNGSIINNRRSNSALLKSHKLLFKFHPQINRYIIFGSIETSQFFCLSYHFGVIKFSFFFLNWFVQLIQDCVIAYIQNNIHCYHLIQSIYFAQIFVRNMRKIPQTEIFFAS